MIKDVIIIGCGPTGAVLALLLAKQGLNITVLEKDEVYPVPRATHIDEETLRNFQLTGLIDELLKHTQPFGNLNIIEDGKVLLKEEVIQPKAEHGYTGSRFFDQTAFERVMRTALKQMPNVELIIGEEATGISQDENTVSIATKTNSYTAQYAVACDGGRSMVRQALGIQMHYLEPARDWIIVDSLLKDPADENLLPDGFCYLLEKERLTINAHGFGLNRRWEFQLNKGEAQPADDVVKSWVAKYINVDKIEITRIAKYAHNSLVAERWRNGRILLAGDAAHMMPPSAGQGLCSGVRDAVNLAWRLNDVLKGKNFPEALDRYEYERKAHVYQILKRTLFLSGQFKGDNALQRWLRNKRLRVIEGMPIVKNYLRKKYNVPIDIIGFGTRLGGKHLPQLNNSDDAIGYRHAWVAKSNTLTAEQLEIAKEQGIVVIQKGFDEWLTKQGVKYVSVRPDKVIDHYS